MASITRTGPMKLPSERSKRGPLAVLRRHPTAILGGAILLAMVCVAVFAPFLGTVDPQKVSPIFRLRPPSERFWFGTDISPSMKRIRMLSASRMKPVTRPISRPTAVARIATPMPTVSETRVP